MAVWSEVFKSKIIKEHRFDAEFYDPKYHIIERALEHCQEKKRLGVLANRVKKGIFDISPSRYKTKGVPLIRTFQIKTPVANEENLVYITESDHKTDFSKTELLAGDIVFTKIGAGIGDVAVLPNTYPVYNFSQNVAGLSIKKDNINPYYLVTFLNSFYGKQQIHRYMMPSGQGKLELRDIKLIIIPRFDESIELRIEKIMFESERKILLSKSLYTQAQELLEKELELDQLVLKKPKSYEIKFSEIVIAGRNDPEFHNPYTTALVNKIKAYNSFKLSESFVVGNGFPWVSSNFQDQPNGIPVIRIRNIRPGVIDIEQLNTLPEKYVKKCAAIKAKKNDLVIGMDGIKYFYAGLIDGESMINQRVAHLKPKESSKISSEYLMFIINERLGQAQLLRDMTIANTVGHITNSSIRNLLIPLPSLKIHDEITDLVKNSIKAKKESEQLLDQAKLQVEGLIEGAIQ